MSRAKARAALMQELENAMRRSSAQGVHFRANRCQYGRDFRFRPRMPRFPQSGRPGDGRPARRGHGADHRRHHRRGRPAGEGGPGAPRARSTPTAARFLSRPSRRTSPRSGGSTSTCSAAMVKLWRGYSDAELRLLLRVRHQGLRDHAGSDRGAQGDGRCAQENANEKAGAKPAGKASGPRKPSRAP